MNETIGRAVDSVVGGLKSTPMLLTLLLLNAVGIAAATWVLFRLIDLSDKRMAAILAVCVPK